MIVKNNSSKRYFSVGGVPIPPGGSMTVDDRFYDDIAGAADLAVTSGAPADGGVNYATKVALIRGGGTVVDVSGIIVVSSAVASDADGLPDGTIHFQVA